MDTREDAHVLDAVGEIGVGQAIELGPVDREVALAGDPEQTRHGHPGSRMVARHHHRLDPGGATTSHRVCSLGPGRIDLAHQPEQHRPVLEGGESGVTIDLGVLDARNREHAKRTRGHALDGGARRATRRLVERRIAAAPPHGPTQIEDNLGGPLEQDVRARGRRMLRGHQLRGRIEGQLGAPRETLPQLRRDDTGLHGEREQGGLGGIADLTPARVRCMRRDELRVVAQNACLEQGSQARIRRGQKRLPSLEEASLGCVAGARHGDLPAIPENHGRDGQLVPCQGAGLVAADDRRATERLDRCGAAHDGAATGHALHPHGEPDRHRDGKPFRDHPHDLADREHGDLAERNLAQQTDRKDRCEQADRDPDQAASELVDATFEWRPGLGSRLGQLGDPTDLRRQAGGHHDCARAPRRDVRARVEHVPTVRERRVRGEREQVLRHGQRFPSERRFGDLDRRALEEPGIGGDRVSGRDQQDVARDDVVCRDGRLAPLAQDAGLAARQAPQRLERALGPPFLKASRSRRSRPRRSRSPLRRSSVRSGRRSRKPAAAGRSADP